jgi:hypothetical protein
MVVAAGQELAPFGSLNPWYYSDASATVRSALDMARRISTFDEVSGGATRPPCTRPSAPSCGNCFEDDNC